MNPNLDTFESLENEIEKLKTEFYGSSKKSLFFTKKQKFECASQIMTKLSLDSLLQNTCRIIPQYGLVYIDYVMFKSYATPEIFDYIADYIIQVFSDFRKDRGHLAVAINLDTFTISALERYKPIISIFCDKCFQQRNEFEKSLETFSIYNIPSTFDTIRILIAPLVAEEIRDKIRLVGKPESAKILRSFGIA